MMKKLLSTLGVIALGTTLALAADDKPPGEKPPGGPGGEGRRPAPEDVVKKLDTDGNGTVSLEEFKAGPRAQKDPAKAEEAFKRMDKDGNGELTVEEFKAGRPPRDGGPGGPGKERRGQKGPGEKPPGAQ